MYADNANKLGTNSQDEIQVTIRNLPNDASTEDIVGYLEIAGPIKSHRFLKEEERYSAIVVYHDAESAQQCRKNLNQRYFKGRALTITVEAKKNYQNLQQNIQIAQPEDDLIKQIANLKKDERKQLLGMLKNIKSDGKIFEMFLQSRPKLVEALLNKSYSD